jgi:lipopolysaccharide/colanic/teichoic acid biosynthesis glycosyltransferase
VRGTSPRCNSRGGSAILKADLDGAVRPGLPRTVEVPLALVGLAVAAPFIGAAAVAIVVCSGLPVFFRQARIGRGGHPFVLIKLRSMRVGVGGPKITARGDARVTPVGRILRKTKLDELPELWNVLRGEMSFVGPRPEVPEFVDGDNPLWREVLLVRPGLTDPTTVRLRDEELLMAALEEEGERYYREFLQPLKLQGYVEYLRRRTWLSDLSVIWRTIATLARFPGPSSKSPRSSTDT